MKKVHSIIYIQDDGYNYWIRDYHYYGIHSTEKFMKYFFNFLDVGSEYSSNTKKNIIIYGIQDTIYEDNSNNNINTLVSVENCNYWKHYKHYNLFGNYGDSKIKIYIYNHITNFIKTENYIVIPVIYLQIDYFLNYYNQIKPSNYIHFTDKKDCLIVSSNARKQHKYLDDKINAIKKLFNCQYIKNITELKNISCYHSIPLLNEFNKYKFIICFENSLTNGYITEKIFNVFFSRSIPIYLGPNDKLRYFNKECFIDLSEHIDKILQKMIVLNNEKMYNEYINSIKINSLFNNEDYKSHSKTFIKSLLH